MQQRMRFGHVVAFSVLVSILVFYLSADKHGCEPAANSSLGTPLQPAPSKQHIVVTGGAGYIGSHATKRLLQEGHAVTIVDNMSRGNIGAIRILQRLANPGRLQFIHLDLGNAAALSALFARVEAEVVMHFAAVAYVGESMADPLLYYQNITSNTINVLTAMKANKMVKLVYSSTCATYGNPALLPVTEDTPAAPINPYGKAKLAAEEAIREYSRSEPAFKAIIFRYFNVYGSDPQALLGEYPRPELREHGRISGACMDAALKAIKSLKIQGTRHPTRDGTCVRDYIHVEDVVSAHALGLSHLANPPALYNIGTGQGITVREFVDACLKVTGAAIVVDEQAEARPGDYAAVWADPSKIEHDLGWRAKYTSVEESLGHAWAWRRRHPEGYLPARMRGLQ